MNGVALLASRLLGHRGEDLTLDAGEVRRLSGLGLEVLVAASLQWRADGKALRFVNWSEAAQAALEGLGAELPDVLPEA